MEERVMSPEKLPEVAEQYVAGWETLSERLTVAKKGLCQLREFLPATWTVRADVKLSSGGELIYHVLIRSAEVSK